MEFQKQQAIYLQIADHICEMILLKKWGSDDRIPSARELAVNMEVNPNTVMRTFSYLQEKGIIYNKRGIGYFISDQAYQKVCDLKTEEFFNQSLPSFFKTLDLLGLDIKNITQKYHEYKDKGKINENE